MNVSSYLQDVTHSIGNTPLLKLSRFSEKGAGTVYGKAEFMNPGGSVKDRISLNMINEAERQGLLKAGGTILEPTSGNTGIGLALIAAVRGYKMILVMPESMSQERISLLNSYGVELILTPAYEGMQGSIKEAQEILAKHPEYYMPNQFKNPANPEIHRKTTGVEIWNSLNGEIDAFVTGVGTGGTITGVGELLKSRNSKIQVIAVEPASSPVLSGGMPGPHKIQGIGAGFVPQVLNRKILDRVITVGDDDAYRTSKRLSREEGIMVGISSGANAFAALQVAREMGPNKSIVTTLCDTGERYISMEKYFNI
ncbi:MAG TPA: cysteine synthase A [Nitrospiria bacterium]|nr:cysteine synthase A [Nitrospiria bacterium]